MQKKIYDIEHKIISVNGINTRPKQNINNQTGASADGEIVFGYLYVLVSKKYASL